MLKSNTNIAWKIECKKKKISDFQIVHHGKDGHIPSWNDPYHT